MLSVYPGASVWSWVSSRLVLAETFSVLGAELFGTSSLRSEPPLPLLVFFAVAIVWCSLRRQGLLGRAELRG
jgi:hypothetical protein